MEIIGYISAVFLAICGLPTMLISIKRGNSDHIDPYLLTLWYVGEICGSVYAIHLESLPLILNYMTNTLFLTIIVIYKIYPRK